MSNVLTSSDAIIEQLGNKYSKAYDLPLSSVNEIVTDASDITQSALSRQFVTFNALDHATYPAPEIVQRMATAQGVYLACLRLVLPSSNPGMETFAAARLAEFESLRIQILGIDFQFEPERVSGETLTLVTETEQAARPWGLEAHTATIGDGLLTSGDTVQVLPDTVRINNTSVATGYTGDQLALMRQGHEYQTEFRTGIGRYIFKALNAALWESVTTLKIDYQFSYRRKEGESVRHENILSFNLP